MPFQSQDQKKYLYANKPDVAKKFAADPVKVNTDPGSKTSYEEPLKLRKITAMKKMVNYGG